METTVTTEVVDLDKLFPGIDAEDVLTSKVPNILSNDNDISFLDKKPGAEKIEDPKPGGKENQTDPLEDPAKPGGPVVDQKEADKILNSIGKDESEEEGEYSAGDEGKGRPKSDKSALASYLKEKIEAGEFAAFEDWDEKKQSLDDYLLKQSEKSLHQMLDANWESKERDLLERTPQEFFESLPEELQYAARYVMEGGQDMKSLFAALARVEQVRELDPESEDGQVIIARNYLQATNFGTPDEIEDEIANWKESNRLEKKAKDFKPKLDQMQKQQVEYQLAQQADFSRQQREAAQMYVANVGQALQKGELNGIKLDRKTQAMLYEGLTNVAYPSASGKATNLLGHLLDKIQYVEPDFELLAEVTYLLADPEGFKNNVRQQGKNTATTEIVKKLKTEQQLATGSSFTPGDDDEPSKPAKRKLTKPRNLFER
jgi:hypothetical protein